MLVEWSLNIVKAIVIQCFDWFMYMLNSVGGWELWLGAFCVAMCTLFLLMPLRGQGFSALTIGSDKSGLVRTKKADKAKSKSTSKGE